MNVARGVGVGADDLAPVIDAQSGGALGRGRRGIDGDKLPGFGSNKAMSLGIAVGVPGSNDVAPGVDCSGLSVGRTGYIKPSENTGAQDETMERAEGIEEVPDNHARIIDAPCIRGCAAGKVDVG